MTTTTTRGARRGAGALLPALLCAMLAATAATAETIRYDLGGEVEARIAQIQRWRATGTPVRIEGTCISACTLYLGLPNACVTPGAQLGFHGPRTRLLGIPLPRAEFERQTQIMAAYYPGAIRAWFMSEARMVTESYYVLSGSQAVAMGARACA